MGTCRSAGEHLDLLPVRLLALLGSDPALLRPSQLPLCLGRLVPPLKQHRRLGLNIFVVSRLQSPKLSFPLGNLGRRFVVQGRERRQARLENGRVLACLRRRREYRSH